MWLGRGMDAEWLVKEVARLQGMAVSDLHDELPADLQADPLVGIPAPVDTSSMTNLDNRMQALFDITLTEYSFRDVLFPRFRQWCMAVVGTTAYSCASFMLVLASTILYALLADEIISDEVGWKSESVLAVAFLGEFIVRLFGTPGKPWRCVTIVCHGILAVIVICDLWVAHSLMHLGLWRPHWSALVVLRLVAVSPLWTGLDNLGMGRPLRLLNRLFLKGPGLMMAFNMAIVGGLLACGICLRAMARRMGSPTSDRFPSFTDTFICLSGLLAEGRIKGREISELRDGTGDGFISSGAADYAIIVVLHGLLAVLVAGWFLGLVVEHVVHIGQNDDKRAILLAQREKVDIKEIAKWLERLDLNRDGKISALEMTLGYKNHSELEKMFGMPLEKAVALHRIIDTSSGGDVPMDLLLLAIMSMRCLNRDTDQLVLDHAMSRSRVSLNSCSLSMRALHKDMYGLRRHSDEALSETLERQNVGLANAWQVQEDIAALGTQVDRVFELVSLLDSDSWELDDDDLDQLPDEAIGLLSLQFRNRLEEWEEVCGHWWHASWSCQNIMP